MTPSSLLQSLGTAADWVVAALAGLLPIAGVIGTNHRRSRRNKRHLEGTDDPNTEGVLEIAHDTREQVSHVEAKVDEYRKETREEHREVMERLERVTDGGEDE